MWKSSALLAVLSLLGWGQTVELAPVSAAAGSVASMTLTWAAPPGKSAVALEWELSYPSPQLGLEDKDIAAGSTAHTAGKALTCKGRSQDAGTYVYKCILAGGSKPLANGPAAIFFFRVRNKTRKGAATVRLSNTLGVSPEGNSIRIDPSQADVTIR